MMKKQVRKCIYFEWFIDIYDEHQNYISNSFVDEQIDIGINNPFENQSKNNFDNLIQERDDYSIDFDKKCKLNQTYNLSFLFRYSKA